MRRALVAGLLLAGAWLLPAASADVVVHLSNGSAVTCSSCAVVGTLTFMRFGDWGLVAVPNSTVRSTEPAK